MSGRQLSCLAAMACAYRFPRLSETCAMVRYGAAYGAVWKQSYIIRVVHVKAENRHERRQRVHTNW
ncbi:hypothetical protein GSbR_28060 [Geobacter sp. SVR]|nr:hypothetical protein GSVR_23210 [Geobacter sp. SVR]GCF86206.1 hypothetical protein GSbR_28060 [Geobacter sp. SVR]